MKSIHDFSRAKRARQRIALVTAYDVLAARTAAEADVDAILVGDSVAMVVHGHASTIHATVEMMALHTAAVRRGAPEMLVIADMPFLSVRGERGAAVEAAGVLLRAGANAVKIEGVAGHGEIIEHLVESGVPVMGHVGLTPQSYHQLGHRVQGREVKAAARIRAEAGALEAAGAFGVVLECVPSALARRISKERTIPTIGIGAGKGTDGQVLVWTDLLGLDAAFRPSFARAFADGHALTKDALNAYVRAVRTGAFPGAEETPA
ncbi:3-methyl-2-oxobutanoate hydroxymethyltransferase [Horticoccus luteus]|uniref:3-methyl-2-oxobutanoate hydroxymethyltransferase n=1 Tax=Horticoccus luteus TaxID=2862869 RepID=A0A8F9TVJ7_9BACT|nr:3-methyl-2-oxobutanoate hydroxymethyltransferase [Horticoccus luteus]QYM78377.1 3-methyl-2-oxobutanoate hydroxymethyltransferase [Horticoccus luteus]